MKNHPSGKSLRVTDSMIPLMAVGDKQQRTKVFVSYSHKDARWLERLQVHLSPLWDEREVLLWDDTRIEAGALWEEAIDEALRTTRIAILLISADFLASSFVRKREVPELLSAAQAGGATILPLIVAPCMFRETASLSQFQAVNAPDRPLTSLDANAQEQVLLRVAQRVQRLIQDP